MHIRDTSGKRGNPPQLETLLQRQTIKTNKMDTDASVEELDMLKLDIPMRREGLARRCPEPGPDQLICRQTRGMKVWWREEYIGITACSYIGPRECMAAALEKGGPVWREVLVQGEPTEALVIAGASRSFVAPSLVAKLKLPTEEVHVGVRFRVASGSDLVARTVAKQAKFRSGDLETWADLVAQVPYNMILGTDWFGREFVVWDVGHRRLLVQGDKGDLELPVVENPMTTDLGKAPACKDDPFEVAKQQTDEEQKD